MCPVITTTIRAQRALQCKCFLASVYMSLVVGFILRLQQLLNGYVNSFLSTIPPLLAARTPWTRCGQSVGVCFCAVSQSNICALEESYLSTLGVCVQFSSRRHSSLTFIFYILWSSVACRNCYFCKFLWKSSSPTFISSTYRSYYCCLSCLCSFLLIKRWLMSVLGAIQWTERYSFQKEEDWWQVQWYTTADMHKHKQFQFFFLTHPSITIITSI